MKRIFTVMILMLMSISAWAGNGSIKMTRVEFDTKDSNGNNGMRIHLTATTTGFKGHRIQFIAFFYNADGSKVYGGVPNYKAVDNHSCSYIEDNALYDGTTWNDNTLFVPYSILTHSAGVNNYKYQLELRDASNRNADIAKSEFYSFQVTFGNSSSSNNNNYSNNNSYRSNNNQPIDPIHPMQGDTYFEYEQNGLKVKTWTHPDESVTMQMSMPCYSCATFVKGRCMNCRGTGNGYYLFPGRYFPCPACGGTSICGTCKGTGIVEDMPRWHPKGSAEAYQGMQRQAQSGSNNGGGSSRTSCPKCNGLRYETQSYSYAAGSTSGAMPPLHNNSGSRCSICSSSSDHYHYPCSECWGHGMIRR